MFSLKPAPRRALQRLFSPVLAAAGHQVGLRAALIPWTSSRIIGVALIATLSACSTSPIQQSRSLWSEGRFEEAVVLLQEASKKDPDDRNVLAAYHRQRDLAVAQLLLAADSATAGRRFDEAQNLYERALRLDPNSVRAKDGIAHIALVRRLDAEFAEAQLWVQQGRTAEAEARLRQIIGTDPSNRAARHLLQQLRAHQQEAAENLTALQSALATPVSVEFRETPLRNVFEVLSRAAGLNFVFDKDVRTESKITIFIRNNPIEDVLKVLLSTNALERKVLNANTLLIYPNTPSKAKEYQDLVARTFYLINADAKQVDGMLRRLRTSGIPLSTRRSMRSSCVIPPRQCVWPNAWSNRLTLPSPR